MAGTLTAAQLAARAGLTLAELQRQIAEVDHTKAQGPNRAMLRAAKKAARKKGRR